jgi:dTMP kinase
MPGKFIVIEGLDGSGKGTIATMLAEWLFKRDKSAGVLLTREPTGVSEAGKKIRELLKIVKDPNSRARDFAKLYVDDREWHIENRIKPALRVGSMVISDRYKHSTLAYQQLQGMRLEELLKMHEGMIVPDLTVVLDISAETAMERTSKDKARSHAEVFEQFDFLKELRGKYLELPQKLKGERIAIVDASKSVKKVFESVKKEVEKIL